MREEELVTGAKIIQVVSPVCVFHEAVLRALAIAGKAYPAFKALPWQPIQFIPSECDLLR